SYSCLHSFIHCSCDNLDLHSFPTRRSSDLTTKQGCWRRSVILQRYADRRMSFSFVMQRNILESWVSICHRNLLICCVSLRTNSTVLKALAFCMCVVKVIRHRLRALSKAGNKSMVFAVKRMLSLL